MIEAEAIVAKAAGTGRVQEGAAALKASVPPQPKTVRETGLEQALIVELVAKVIDAAGKIHLPALTSKLCLSIGVLREVLDIMLSEQMMEVARRGDSDLDVEYQLTMLGKQRAAEYSARCRYAGPAPVSLQAYREVAQRQSRQQTDGTRISTGDLAAVFADDCLDAGARELIGAALQSSRSLLLYGPSGSGKSTLARKLGQFQQGLVAVPYAILVGRHIIEFHDPAVHLPPTGRHSRHAENQRSVDARWTLCQRPLVHVGAELTQQMLDLRYDAIDGVYQAPPHFLANNGMLIVDDLGRQRIAPSDLLNRWTGPLDVGTDQLTLEGGHKFSVPFDPMLVFATNFAPQLLFDDSCMRRVGYKIQIGALGEANYRALFRHQCRIARLACDEAVLEHLLTRLHASAGRALLASYPRELLGRIADFAGFAGTTPRLTIPALEQAWASMFTSSGTVGASAPAQPPAPFSANGADLLFERI
jgi:hypothetical protein